MRKGSFPRSIALPTSAIEPDYAPDGLTEAAIDALIAQTDTETNTRPRPGWLSADHTTVRRSRRAARQVLRTLPAEIGGWSPEVLEGNFLIGGMLGQGKSSATCLAASDLDSEVA
jgi:hypothetical protein